MVLCQKENYYKVLYTFILYTCDLALEALVKNAVNVSTGAQMKWKSCFPKLLLVFVSLQKETAYHSPTFPHH